MKNLYVCLILICSGSLFAQTDVYFKINHLLGTTLFAFHTTASNNLGHSFDVGRLQYYISEITIIHDGGTETHVDDHWILVDASSPTNDLLGNFPITTIEGLRFGVGVESAYNHLDPASYSVGHPLAPQAPSMHWGWLSGYRFVALEGNSGSGLGQVYQIHALGDKNYRVVSIVTGGTTDGSDLVVELNADYEMALKDIDVASGLVNHGEVDEAEDLLMNFSTDVFTSIEGNGTTLGIEDLSQNRIACTLAPNPASTHSKLFIEGDYSDASTVTISDLSGRIVQETSLPRSGELSLHLSEGGVYILTVYDQGIALANKRLVITE